MTSGLLRPIEPADHGRVLAWNEAHVELLAPLDGPRLEELLGFADLGAVIHHEGRDVGFLLTFASGASYDSVNYRWFAARHDAFYYLDRVVVAPAFRRSGIGSAVYDEVEERARAVAPVMCLEVNLQPPNEPSLAFHDRRGYHEVGRQDVAGHLVSLREKELR
jgi:predicted GNAT superfamily acetyltransferase